MMNSTLLSALLLCSLSWISVSVSESQTVEVQPGEEVTLLCSISRSSTHTFWSRLVNRAKISCIASAYGSNMNASFCDGFQNGNFEMRSNISTVFLKIKQVDLSDSGMYFCGFYIDGHTVINVIHLNVHGNDESHDVVNVECEEEFDGIAKLMSVILGGLTVFLVMLIIGLIVKSRKLQTAHNEEHNPQNQNLGSDDLNYAAPSFHPKTKRNRRPASESELEPNVVYAATR
ncbi:uncharacterized protein LOC122869810 [Siniperca chuatsi]|uniref:uncharacterized protein LOC122869810 n=1 Tax=Siniperca chuatsi TaxID=119488 RepID=UPI001CE0967D|nr:uncharacterized protein LOC122869810 [Siniperca chuatsi]